MNDLDVTVVVGPRERFSQTRQTLDTLFAHTPAPFELVYVDGGVPTSIRRWLESESQARGFTLLGDGSYLSPDCARNLGFSAVKTKYVVFLDNDVVVAPGWLEALVDCAEETGAWIVGPLYCVDRPYHTVIHMAGGTAHVEDVDGTRRFIEHHVLMGESVASARPQLVRGPTEAVEFHCLLARADTIRALGPLDSRFCSVPEGQVDLCLKVRALGGEVWIAPDAVVTYDRPWTTGMPLSDVPYYLMRWSARRGRRGLEHFRRVWDLAPDDPYIKHQLDFMRWQRSHALRPLLRLIDRIAPNRGSSLIELFAGWIALASERILRPSAAGGW